MVPIQHLHATAYFFRPETADNLYLSVHCIDDIVSDSSVLSRPLGQFNSVVEP